MAEPAIIPVILLNGSGAGLGPLPRQTVSPLQTAATLFAAGPIVVCAAQQRVLVTEQLSRTGAQPRMVLLESGNTPTALVAALLAAEADGHAIVLVFAGLSEPIDAAALRQAAGAALPSVQAGAVVDLVSSAKGQSKPVVLAGVATLLDRYACTAPALVAACRQAMADAERNGTSAILRGMPSGNFAAMLDSALRPDQPAAPETSLGGGITQRPWGRFHSIARGERFQVKHIEVDPGAKLSLQKHWHRSEHWVVVAGTALVTNGDDTFILRENQSTFIPATVVHRLENPGKVPLRLIEVQSGEYVGEDDIVRLDDSYGR